MVRGREDLTWRRPSSRLSSPTRASSGPRTCCARRHRRQRPHQQRAVRDLMRKRPGQPVPDPLRPDAAGKPVLRHRPPRHRFPRRAELPRSRSHRDLDHAARTQLRQPRPGDPLRRHARRGSGRRLRPHGRRHPPPDALSGRDAGGRSRACCGRRRVEPAGNGWRDGALAARSSARFKGHAMAQTAIHARMTAAEWALLVGLSVLWGGSFLFVGVAVAELPPLTIVVAPRRACGGGPSPGAALHGRGAAARAAGLGRLPRHGRPQQRHPVHPHRLGPGPHRERRRLDPQRHDAAVHRRRRALAHRRRAHDGAQARRRRDRIWRRRGDDRRRGAADARRRCPGAARGPRRRDLLRLRRRLRPPLQGDGRRPGGDRRRDARPCRPCCSCRRC